MYQLNITKAAKKDFEKRFVKNMKVFLKKELIGDLNNYL